MSERASVPVADAGGARSRTLAARDARFGQLLLAPTLPGRVGCTARSRIPCGCGPFLCSLPPNPACTFQRTGLSSDLCRVRDRVCVDPVISCRARGERQVPLRLSALRIPHGSLIVHRLCPFALWTVISGLQIGRTLPRRLMRALRRHRTRVP